MTHLRKLTKSQAVLIAEAYTDPNVSWRVGLTSHSRIRMGHRIAAMGFADMLDGWIFRPNANSMWSLHVYLATRRRPLRGVLRRYRKQHAPYFARGQPVWRNVQTIRERGWPCS